MKNLSPIPTVSTAVAALCTLVAQTDQAQAAVKRPNIIVILVDDMGFSDPGCFGGEIHTPNIDFLASHGVRFNRFYNCGRSCPTRASLLTGLYPHKAGVGRMAKHTNQPGYEGTVKKEAVTIAEVLSQNGYNTAMVGKWHISATEEIADHREWLANRKLHEPYVALDSYPTARGFQYFYGLLWGVTNYFNPFSMVDGTKPVTDFPKDYYITDDFTTKAVDYIRSQTSQQKPFFLYLAYTAPHWPLQAPEKDIEAYKDTYTCGWEAIRNARYERMKQLGLFTGQQDYLSPRQSQARWADDPTQAWDARAMATHAAMVSRVDTGIGQVVEALKKSGTFENTLILFMSDNGCSPETPQNMSPGHDDRADMLKDGTPIIYPKNKEVMPGPANTMTGLGPLWANVSNAPFRFWKAKMYEGGIHTPMIACWGKGLRLKQNSINSTSGHVIDIMATCLDVAGVKRLPTQVEGKAVPQQDGRSLLPVLRGKSRPETTLYFEHFGEKAIRLADGWKAVCPARTHEWELYDLNSDLSEMHNLADRYPEKLARMRAEYEQWAERSLVYPTPDGSR